MSMDLLEKQKVLDYLSDMPDQFSADEMIDRIITLSKIERGLRDVEAGRVKSNEAVIEKFRAWQQR
jgi:predicted transcriptional regulator